MSYPELKLPVEIPVMVLPSCNLLPHGLLPLYIFEQRYRQMLADSLAANRLFAIGTVDPEGLADVDQAEILEFSCAGMIRACVKSEDGSSHLVLQGLQRIHFTGWSDTDKPYRVAQIEPVPTRNANPESAAPLARRAVELAHEVVSSGHASPSAQALEEIETLDDPDTLADLIAYQLIRNPLQRQPMLGMEDIGDRLQFLISELAGAGPSLP